MYDQGTEFKGRGFQQLLATYGLHGAAATVKNPQANSICERMHQTAANALRILLRNTPPNDAVQAGLLLDSALQTAAFGIRAAIHTTLKTTPGALVFHRDMFLDIPVISDLEVIRQHRQAAINHNLLRANSKRLSYDYKIGDQVLKLIYSPNKLEPRTEGPYPINTIHVNGTVTLQRSPTTEERINIRRIRPYFNA
jgi:hypothetical protein